MLNPVFTVLELLEDLPNPRQKNVISCRFGIEKKPETLEAIGEKYGITRERVRQIEKRGLEFLSQPKFSEKISPLLQLIHGHLKEYGDLKREEKLLDDLSDYFSINEKQKREENIRGAIHLILELGDEFQRYTQDRYFYPLWTINEDSFKTAQKIVFFLQKYFEETKKLLEPEEILFLIRKNIDDISSNALFSYLDASSQIFCNCFNQYGLGLWKEISPRSVKDKAYLVFRKEQRPMHFRELTDLINLSNWQENSKNAHHQTVHNELIKDERFVLIGRGIYSLKEWGYRPGTVLEIITQIIKENGALNKNDILEKVRQERQVKEQTILVNLQNRKHFSRSEDGRYIIKNF